MGVDVVFKARPQPSLSREQFEDVQRRFCEAYPDLNAEGDDRYYGIGYERGYWPQIREMGNWLAANIPGEVRYGADTADEWEYLRPWPEVLEELDAHWEQHENRPYYERRR